ncbi:hypothetical protein CEXT_133791 [Caerostris extrusa]|uniref:Uncharacterized protein n=1 Tax=Caerostris extrusa TaxID=172846 RepID=A0AAV4WKG2_CAEEX|nr:hypothetical protein CEXT_133791 [Caerostris extrusa]
MPDGDGGGGPHGSWVLCSEPRMWGVRVCLLLVERNPGLLSTPNWKARERLDWLQERCCPRDVSTARFASESNFCLFFFLLRTHALFFLSLWIDAVSLSMPPTRSGISMSSSPPAVYACVLR